MISHIIFSLSRQLCRDVFILLHQPFFCSYFQVKPPEKNILKQPLIGQQKKANASGEDSIVYLGSGTFLTYTSHMPKPYAKASSAWKEHSLELQAKLRKLNFLFFHLKNNFNVNHLKRIYVPLYELLISGVMCVAPSAM